MLRNIVFAATLCLPSACTNDPIFYGEEGEPSLLEFPLATLESNARTIINDYGTLGVGLATSLGLSAPSKTPFYGNWCGAGHPKQGSYPAWKDELDKACMIHDLCYGQRGYHNCQCDTEFVETVMPLLKDNSSRYDGKARPVAQALAAKSCHGCKMVTWKDALKKQTQGGCTAAEKYGCSASEKRRVQNNAKSFTRTNFDYCPAKQYARSTDTCSDGKVIHLHPGVWTELQKTRNDWHWAAIEGPRCGFGRPDTSEPEDADASLCFNKASKPRVTRRILVSSAAPGTICVKGLEFSKYCHNCG